MPAALSTSTPDDDRFANVAGLEPNGPDAAGKLRKVYDQLVALGAGADAERLLVLDHAAGRRDYVALERMLAIEHPLDQLSELQHSRLRNLVGWRNAVVLVPLLFTWLVLGWASWRYHEQLKEHPNLSTQPFLVLWEQRFGGEFIPTFSLTAVLAFAFLTLVLLLTVWAHRRETRSNRELAEVRAQLDEAMSALALATETSSIRPPVSAEEWAEAAQRVLTETQRLISAAVEDTRALAESNRQIATSGREATEKLHTDGLAAMTAQQEQGREFVGNLATETLTTMAAVRTENAQLIAGTTEQAKLVLQRAGEANKQLVEQQMTPLFEGFRNSLQDYRSDHRVYAESAAAMASGVTELTAAARTLGESAGTYSTIAASIDKHLQQIETTQSGFVKQVTENSQSMTTAATSMREVTELMSGRMRGDLEALARNVVDASGRLKEIDRELVSTSAALEATTAALQATATNLAAVSAALTAPRAPRRPRTWRDRITGR
ncbi:hypothetical protein [Micromonospora carbonacea]|uniref:Methyl-accepting chemotaxis protein n=1 Tax=Micromonospora carbonacea TaxID=47853 RepID=A0A7H8XT96_9ACTN|nr:hypothetical protein [Micromonospora carbonacea]MBB5830035.1 hypothetical protein [Micromonospora carbonacea]QLD28025.1 hypothetical protein HXZ27_30625 [Micromonospora carbonacea]